jgi:hypothetical protein
MRGNEMKQIKGIIAIGLLLFLLGVFVLPNIGYEKIHLPEGTLYGRSIDTGSDVVVLLIAGSGPTDMDGNTPVIDGRNDSLIQLAKSLEEKGISTLRYDKRTAGKSADSIETKMLDFDQLVSDCVAWIRHAKTLGYERIYLAGHSQGSLIAMLASKQESVDGVISLAGAGFPIDITLERQLLEQLDADSEEFSVIRGLREGRLDPSMKSDSILSLDKQEFLLTWMKYDPSTIISSLPCPALILQGSVDLQVDDGEFDRLTKASPQSLAVMIENMNHVLKPVRSEKENLSSYSDPAIAIEPRLVDAIATFVQ